MLGGDFNAYAKETPITTIIDGGYVSVTDLGKTDPPAYSYVFDGQWGTLDYIFLRESFADSLVEASTWAVNSDELDYLDYNLDFGRDPAIFDGTTPFRFSDHDPIVLNLKIKKAKKSSKKSLRSSSDDINV
jgi:predicted extracellular nuclease